MLGEDDMFKGPRIVAVVGLSGLLLLMGACSTPKPEASTEAAGTAIAPDELPAPGEYGSDPRFDKLYDQCKGGNEESCSTLYWESPADSEYEAFALGRMPRSLTGESWLDEGEYTAEVDLEGSVATEDGKFVEYPDGLVITFVSVELMPNGISGYINSEGAVVPLPAGQALVRVAVLAENNGPEPVVLNSYNRPLTLLYGANRYEADQDPGYFGEESSDILTSEEPERIAPASSHKIFMSFNVPVEELGELAARVDLVPGYYTPYIFTEVHTVLE
jgi:hypothetical protein